MLHTSVLLKQLGLISSTMSVLTLLMQWVFKNIGCSTEMYMKVKAGINEHIPMVGGIYRMPGIILTSSCRHYDTKWYEKKLMNFRVPPKCIAACYHGLSRFYTDFVTLFCLKFIILEDSRHLALNSHYQGKFRWKSCPQWVGHVALHYLNLPLLFSFS